MSDGKRNDHICNIDCCDYFNKSYYLGNQNHMSSLKSCVFFICRVFKDLENNPVQKSTEETSGNIQENDEKMEEDENKNEANREKTKVFETVNLNGKLQKNKKIIMILQFNQCRLRCCFRGRIKSTFVLFCLVSFFLNFFLFSVMQWLKDQPPLTEEQLSTLSITLDDFKVSLLLSDVLLLKVLLKVYCCCVDRKL